MMDYLDWPKLPKGVGRDIYVNKTLGWSERANLTKNGYKVVDVRLLPNETSSDKKELVQAYLLGIVDGTIIVDEEKRKYLELLAKTEGMLVNKSISGKINLTCDGETLQELLKFGDTRHTLVSASKEEIAQAKLESITPGAAKDDKVCEDP